MLLVGLADTLAVSSGIRVELKKLEIDMSTLIIMMKRNNYEIRFY